MDANRRCERCEDNLPLTREYYRQYKDRNTGLYTDTFGKTCNKCVNANRVKNQKDARARRREKRQQKADPMTHYFWYGRVVE